MYRKRMCMVALALSLFVAGSAAAQVGQGKVLFEYWEGIGGTNINSNLKSLATYPDSPTWAEWRSKFQSQLDRADNYGARARAFLTAPADGDYTFWVAGDDNCELWLSTDATAANAVKIAEVLGWSGPAEWTREAGQKSAPKTLVGGQTYYIEALVKEGSGGDSLNVAWAGPGIGDAPIVLEGNALRAFIRDPEPLFGAHDPNPRNGEPDWLPTNMFECVPGMFATETTWSLGASPDALVAQGALNFPAGDGKFMGVYLDVLEAGATYYWRADTTEADGVHLGPVWSFTVMPMGAHFPSPFDGRSLVRADAKLSWTAGQMAMTHYVYLGTDQALVTARDKSVLVGEALIDASFDPKGLAADTKYYWCVDEDEGMGGPPVAGDVWSFSTFSATGGAVAQYWNNTTLSGVPYVETIVSEVNYNWPDAGVKGVNSPHAAINTNNFSCRWTAELNVPVTGTYKLYDATDDGCRLYLDGVYIAGNYNFTNGSWAGRGVTEDASADLQLTAGQRYVVTMEMYEGGGGAGAYLRWSGPGFAKEVIPPGALQIPKGAVLPDPADKAVDVADLPVLNWLAGQTAAQHLVYFGTDQALVQAGDMGALKGATADDFFPITEALTWNKTYYWRIDSVLADGSMVPGLVWSFTTANFVVINLPEVTLNYNNAAEPFTSELVFDVPADLTKGGGTDLALRFIGAAARTGQGGVVYDAATGIYSVSGEGADIWGTADQFTYAYKTLEGDGSIVAKVVSRGTGTNGWAKGGVMIRQSLAARSAYAIMAVTGANGSGNGLNFQWRNMDGMSAQGGPNPASKIDPPYWVKLDRVGDVITASMSPDGVAWTQLGVSETIRMADPIYVGLAITSHVAGTLRTYDFSDVSTTGNVPEGPFTASANVGGNSIMPLYAAIEDAAGKVAVVTNTDPNAVIKTAWGLWRIPLSEFADVNVANAAKLHLGVGNGQPDGFGAVRFADVRVVKTGTLPAAGAADVTLPGDAVVGEPNDGDWPAAEAPAFSIDDLATTKFLYFKGELMPSGIIVTPSTGYSVVTGLTLTTANDRGDRDPATFELYGSNLGVDGPWNLIAKGAVDDFTRPVEWPRRTKNVTPIGFANVTPYASYKLMFPTLRAITADCMQVAEVELLGVPAEQPIILAVVRANGRSGKRTDGSPINGSFVGDTTPVPMQAGGLMDGNFCYSDRNYPWANTPVELVGAEYVLTFNDDKNSSEKDVTYTVTTSREATIALTVDDRIPAEWTAAGAPASAQAAADLVTAAFAPAGTFVDTGLDLFVKESATTNRKMSVFAAKLPAGTYVFGAMWSNKNYYTIGAMD